MGSSRSLHQDNIVILCEGTKTEYQYFCSIRDYLNNTNSNRFSDIKIVPVESEMVNPPGSRKKRKLKRDNSGLNLNICYYCLQEDSAQLYEQYKSEPTRFVRETYLFMERGRYKYGWAVYDHDDHPDRQNADVQARKWGVKIAFSSRCFEEWLLMHFERNDTIFTTSECKDTNGNEKRCGIGIPDSCHGEICIGGCLREKNFIPNYKKTDVSNLFTNYTLPRLEQSLVNSAWLNHLEEGTPYYDRRRYTNVGDLILFLLGKNEHIEYKEFGDFFSYRGTRLRLGRQDNSLTLSNIGDIACILTGTAFYLSDSFQQLGPIVSQGLLSPGQSIQCNPYDHDAQMICFNDSSRKIIYCL